MAAQDCFYTMYCLTNMCYVCLEKKDKSLVNITSSLAVNKDIMRIISDLPFNLGWMKAKPIILICEECCRRLRETYQLLAMCLKNSAVLQGYMDKLNAASTSDAYSEAELRVDINNEQDDIHKIKREIKLEEEELYTFGPIIIEETEDVFVNVNDAFVKEEDMWKREVVDGEEEHPMDDNSIESSDNESDVNWNTHDTDTDVDSSESTSTQVHTTNKKELNTAAKKSHKCLTCSKSFSAKSNLQRHTRIHTGEKPYKCAICEKCFTERSVLKRHMRIHTGEKPYKCATCEKCFTQRVVLESHMRTHTGEKPFKCSNCEKGFYDQSHVVRHMRTHTGEKPYECTVCKKCFIQRCILVRHMRTHTGEKPYECATCKKLFKHKQTLVTHMRVHTGAKPSE